jgi:hypothetical protein
MGSYTWEGEQQQLEQLWAKAAPQHSKCLQAVLLTPIMM